METVTVRPSDIIIARVKLADAMRSLFLVMEGISTLLPSIQDPLFESWVPTLEQLVNAQGLIGEAWDMLPIVKGERK